MICMTSWYIFLMHNNASFVQYVGMSIDKLCKKFAFDLQKSISHNDANIFFSTMATINKNFADLLSS